MKARTGEYRSWSAMHARCYGSHAQFKDYGGRGIQICERWHKSNQNAFANFVADMGAKPNSEFTIDRINGDLSYMPSNCRWATRKQQQENARNFQRSKTHCPKGHAYTVENIIQRSDNSRVCRTCNRARVRAQKLR